METKPFLRELGVKDRRRNSYHSLRDIEKAISNSLERLKGKEINLNPFFLETLDLIKQTTLDLIGGDTNRLKEFNLKMELAHKLIRERNIKVVPIQDVLEEFGVDTK